jgi:hypothetical protein
MALADVDGDGKPDAVIGTGSGLVPVMFGSGDRHFAYGLGFSAGGIGVSSVVAADFNGDGLATSPA